MKQRKLFLLLLAFVVMKSNAHALADIATLKSRFYASYLGANTSLAASYLSSIGTDGKWADVNYADQSATNWQPIVHLDRLYTMSVAYQTVGNTYYHNINMLQAISNGLNYWYNTTSITSTNWWYRELGQQLNFEKILILMQGAVSDALLTKGLSYFMNGPKWRSYTSQNLVWLMGQKLQKGILLNDSTAIQQALDTIGQQLTVIKYTGRVQVPTPINDCDLGIQEDGSYLFHGSQLYSGGYGISFMYDQCSYADKVRQTVFAYTADQLNVLSNLVCQTFKMTRKTMIDPSTIGRNISRQGAAALTKGYSVLFDQMTNVLPANAATYLSFKNVLTGKGVAYSFLGNQAFWNADFMNHQRNGFYHSVRTTSARTTGAECLMNGENLAGYWLGYGSSYISRNGTEYYDIFPVWDWAHIPGVTCPNFLPSTSSCGQSETFVGGVSDGVYGCSVMSMNVQKTTAKKAWFCFDKELVALGAGITSTDPNAVSTTLNQCFLKGNVLVDNVAIAPQLTSKLSSPKWVLHDSIGYVFPQASNVVLSNVTQSGSWSMIGYGSTNTVSSNVFCLWLEHGVAPVNAAYQYILVPGVSKTTLSAYAANIPVQVLSNTTSLQAVRQTVSSITQAVFYVAGSVMIPNFTIQVNQPCLLMTRVTNDSLLISASNPVWSNMSLTVTVKDGTTTTKTLSFTFTNGSSGGKTQTKYLLLNNSTTLSPYPQVLPINYTSFFNSTAIGVDPQLEKDSYLNITDTTLYNQWNRSGNGSYWAGLSPVVENNVLSYSNFVDNNKGKLLVLNPTVTPILAAPSAKPPVVASTTRLSGFSLTDNNEYTGKSFYLTALVNVSSVSSNNFILSFDGQSTINVERARVLVNPVTGGYQLGLSFSDTGFDVYAPAVMKLNQSYLVVLEAVPNATATTETASLYVNPVIGSSVKPISTLTVTNVAGLRAIKAIAIHQISGIAAKIGGLRFSDNWADAVRSNGPTTELNAIHPVTATIRKHGKTIVTSEIGKIEVYDLQGALVAAGQGVSVLDPHLVSGIYVVRFTNSIGQVLVQKLSWIE